MTATDEYGFPQWDGATPPDYVAAYKWRQDKLLQFRERPELVAGAMEFYRTRPVEFIEHWVTTYDPRNAGTDKPTRMPMILFPKQKELVRFLIACMDNDADGLVDKSRDMGATWVAVSVSVWLWLYRDDVAIGWGSRKADEVDKLGVARSIFEKIRQTIDGLPPMFLPDGFNRDEHFGLMKIINPANGAAIAGECGDQIGRGGRSSIYFKDEAAYYQRPELIEAALGDNTRCQIDISTTAGVGTVYQRKRDAATPWTGGAPERGATNLFVMDWRDHPDKSQDWYDTRRAKAVREGLLHKFAQEVDRDPTAAIEGVIIPGAWVQAIIDAHEKLDFPADDWDGPWSAALDVADGGIDTNALVARKGLVLRRAKAWAERDTGVTARRTVATLEPLGRLPVQYDCIGVGAGVKSEINRLRDDGTLPKGVHFAPWDAGAGVMNPDDFVIPDDQESPTNKDHFANLKAQGWGALAARCYKTFKAVTEGDKYPVDELISISSEDIPADVLAQIAKELSQPVWTKSSRLKQMVDKTPDGTRSPNYGDSVMMLYSPVDVDTYTLDNL